MKAIIIYCWSDESINECMFEGGIFEGVKLDQNEAEEVAYFIPLTVTGKTYAERKNDLREKAIEYQSSWCDYCGFSYGELAEIQSFFEEQGKRYGLLNEFRENAII